MTKKTLKLLIEDEDSLRTTIELCMRRWESDLSRAWDMTNDMLGSLLARYAFKGGKR